jgi:hypothetical protein
MTAIFISYRRQDTRLIAGRIFEKLETALGAGTVFMDIDRIPFGMDFHTFLDQAAQAGQAIACLKRAVSVAGFSTATASPLIAFAR